MTQRPSLFPSFGLSLRQRAGTLSLSLVQRVMLLAVLVVGGALRLFRLNMQGWSNEYYAAGVRSMLANWHNFWFVAFDPAGFLAVDKPPLGLWLQVLSARMFGFSGVSIVLPQVLAGLCSLLVLFHLVRRTFGVDAGLLAALALALTPVAVATDRNNTIDSTLVLMMLLAAWAFVVASERGALLPLLAGAALLGLGFTIKMGQIALVAPALYGLYLLAAPGTLRLRLLRLAGASLLLGAIALAWVVAVDAIPAALRPFIASSSNSELDLAIGHNGISRIGNPLSGQLGSYFTDEIGQPGPLRLLGAALGGQASWLLPLALFGALALWPVARSAWHTPRGRALLLWLGWLAVQIVFFSISRKFHRYYLVMLAPAVAALFGAGLVELWRAFRQPGWRGWLLPAGLLATALVQAQLALPFGGNWRWLGLAVGVAGIAAAAVLAWLRLNRRETAQAGLALLAALLLVAPGVWATTPLFGANGYEPFAGPQLLGELRFGANTAQIEPLVDFLRANQGGARFLAATPQAHAAAPLILASGEPVMAWGGYSGDDAILTTNQFAGMVAQGSVRYVLLPANATGALAEWTTAACQAVPTQQWQGANAPFTPAQIENPRLFDCGHA